MLYSDPMKKLLFISAIILTAMHLQAQQSGSYFDSRDGKMYKTIIIGSQTWMAESLSLATDSGSWCYDDSNLNCIQFGRFYSFETAQNVCMEGWELPSKEDYDTLLLYVGRNEHTLLALSSEGSSGFGVLFSGWHGEYSGSYNMGDHARFWTSTSKTKVNAWYIGMSQTQNTVNIEYDSKGLGLSVRCIRKRQQ